MWSVWLPLLATPVLHHFKNRWNLSIYTSQQQRLTLLDFFLDGFAKKRSSAVVVYLALQHLNYCLDSQSDIIQFCQAPSC